MSYMIKHFPCPTIIPSSPTYYLGHWTEAMLLPPLSWLNMDWIIEIWILKGLQTILHSNKKLPKQPFNRRGKRLPKPVSRKGHFFQQKDTGEIGHEHSDLDSMWKAQRANYAIRQNCAINAIENGLFTKLRSDASLDTIKRCIPSQHQQMQPTSI